MEGKLGLEETVLENELHAESQVCLFPITMAETRRENTKCNSDRPEESLYVIIRHQMMTFSSGYVLKN